ncbi:sorbosone dehydrogenase family protein [Enterococcus viikkiensis]|uniref:Sorbosone dehydrogenase family protein n=1 Tax=Enterococcus viikkiensis TaxID=930854 RepID=A0ABU3FUT1_9ENTE|nr:sorbosone dehydrogenase family protein [Enterococcus viikkiensis]
MSLPVSQLKTGVTDMKKIVILFIGLFLLSGCAAPISEDEETSTKSGRGTLTTTGESAINQSIETVAENLAVPWSIQRDDDVFYLSERGGTVAKITDGDVERQSMSLEKDLSSVSEAGLLGFVLMPDFSDSQTAIAYYTYEDNNDILNRIVELNLINDDWQEKRVLLDEIPSGTHHHGGRLAIGPDDMLYATTGDASEPEIAQDRNSLGGKILRMNLDGTIPKDNPIEDSYVYSYGHRNAQGLAWNEAGKMYSSEHGASRNDEINVIEAGKNYGWPTIEGNEMQTGMEAPLVTSGSNTTWAPSGMDYRDETLYVAALRGNAVLEFDLESNTMSELLTEYGRIRDIYIEDEMMYFVTNNRDGRGSPQQNDDKLYRLQLD